MLTVLVVEDDVMVAHAIERKLVSWGCHVILASTGEAAVARLREGGGLDAVLSDYSLGAGLDGLDVLSQCRERSPATTRLLTSGGLPGSLPSHLESGLVHAFLGKPMADSELLEALGLKRGP